MQNDLYVEIDTSALAHNLAQVTSFTDCHVMAVIKANAYGHGIPGTAKVFADAGVQWLAVTRIEEAAQIRNAGINTPVLLFSPVLPENAADTIEMDLTSTIDSFDTARSLSDAATMLHKTAQVHVKIDTGMGRLGIYPENAPEFYAALSSLPNIKITGTYTHFSKATEKDISYTQHQHELFISAVDSLKKAGYDTGLTHCSNSSAILRLQDSFHDMVRPGTILYGQYPSKYVPRKLKLKDTWKLKARIADVREIPVGRDIGYGGEYTTKKAIRTAILPVGWGDGFAVTPEGPVYRQGIFTFLARKFRYGRHILINGKKAPVIGRVSMQMICVDITGIPDVHIGDTVEIPAMRIPVSPDIKRIYVDQSAPK